MLVIYIIVVAVAIGIAFVLIKSGGRLDLPQEAFMAVLRLGSE